MVTVGNEDGAHHVAAELYQGLADVGFTIPASAQTYWVGEAMQGTDYKDLTRPLRRSPPRPSSWRPTPRIWLGCSRSTRIRPAVDRRRTR